MRLKSVSRTESLCIPRATPGKTAPPLETSHLRPLRAIPACAKHPRMAHTAPLCRATLAQRRTGSPTRLQKPPHPKAPLDHKAQDHPSNRSRATLHGETAPTDRHFSRAAHQLRPADSRHTSAECQHSPAGPRTRPPIIKQAQATDPPMFPNRPRKHKQSAPIPWHTIRHSCTPGIPRRVDDDS